MKIRFVLAGMICLGLLASCKNATEEIVVSFDESQNASSYKYAGTAEGSVRYIVGSSSYYDYTYTARIEEDGLAYIAYKKSDSSEHTNIQSYTLTVPVILTRKYTSGGTTTLEDSKATLTISFSKIGADYYNNDEKITVDGSPESNSFTFNDTVLPDADNGYIFSNLTFTRK